MERRTFTLRGSTLIAESVRGLKPVVRNGKGFSQDQHQDSNTRLSSPPNHHGQRSDSVVTMREELQTNHESTTRANEVPISLTQSSSTNVEEIREMLATGENSVSEPEQEEAGSLNSDKLLPAFVDLPKKISNSATFHRKVENEKQLGTISKETLIPDANPKVSQKSNQELTGKGKHRRSKLQLSTQHTIPEEQNTNRFVRTANEPLKKKQSPTEESLQEVSPDTIQVDPTKPASMLQEPEKWTKDKCEDQSHLVVDNIATDELAKHQAETPQKIPAELAEKFIRMLGPQIHQESKDDGSKEKSSNDAIDGTQEAKTKLASETKQLVENEISETNNDIETFQEEHLAETGYDETDLKSHSVEVSGVNKYTSQETLKMFFQNRRKSGGGKIDHIWFEEDTGNFVITFENRDGKQVLSINSK